MKEYQWKLAMCVLRPYLCGLKLRDLLLPWKKRIFFLIEFTCCPPEKTWAYMYVSVFPVEKKILWDSDLIPGRDIERISERCLSFLSPVPHTYSKRIDRRGNWDFCLICGEWLKTSWNTKTEFAHKEVY